MSLINKMLRDLDSRHAVSGQESLPSEVRALPEQLRPPRISRRLWLLLTFLTVFGIAAALTPAYWLPLLPLPAAPQKTVAAQPPSLPVKPPPVKAPAAVATPATTLPPAVPAPAAAPVIPAPPQPPLASATPASAQTPADRVLQLPSLSETLSPPEVPSEPAIAPAHKPLAKIASTPAKAAVKPPPAVPAEAKAKPAPTAKRPERAVSQVMIDKAQSSDGRAEADYQLGVAAYKQGRMAAAAAQFKSALQADPRHLAARQTLIAMLAGQKQWADAEALLKEGLQLMPGQTAWAMTLARIEVELNDLPGAWDTLQRYAASAQNDADYQGFAGVLLMRLHKPHEAAAYYQVALRLKPREGRWWLGLGLSLEADGRAAQAQDAFRHAEAADGLTPEMKAFVEKKLH